MGIKTERSALSLGRSKLDVTKERPLVVKTL
jgi:hypothetical protein